MHRIYLALILVLWSFNLSRAQVGSEDLIDLSDQLSLDIRYATQNNFTQEVLYPCGKCLLKIPAAESLLAADQFFREKGYRLRIFDCYRPFDIQRLMWDRFPNPNYVANPNKNGSVHNRGYAVDLSLETLDGKLLDMGTDYDHFGPEAHWGSSQISTQQQNNRELLREGLQQFGFNPIRTEWWHFSYKKNSGDVLNIPLPCKN